MIKNTILIVDDVEINRDLLSDLFSNDYTIMEAANGEQAMEIIQGYASEITMILLDIVMPGKDGFDVLDFMRFNRYMDDIPVIMISASESDDAEMEGLMRGASDFITKPFKGKAVKQRVRNIIELFRYKRSLERIVSEQTEKFMGITEFMIDVLVSVMQMKNSDARQSVQRIRAATRELLNFIYEYCDEKFGLTPQKISLIAAASILHDIGQLTISDELVIKHTQLSEEERKALEDHTQRGCEIIRSMDNNENKEFINMALEICEYHHERWDGSGYPERLVGDEIPISAQVVGLADTYDALRSGYMTGRVFSHEEALDAIVRGDYGSFSPVLTESCKMIGDRLKEIYED